MIYRVIREFSIKDRKYLPGEFVDDMDKRKRDTLIKKGYVVKRVNVKKGKDG